RRSMYGVTQVGSEYATQSRRRGSPSWWTSTTFCRLCTAVLVVLEIIATAPLARAGQGQTSAQPASSASATESTSPSAELPPVTIFGPPPPIAPATASRDEQGRLTIRAVRVMTPLKIDGNLDEAVYSTVPPISDFIQSDPNRGAPATQKTEFWILFDNDN